MGQGANCLKVWFRKTRGRPSFHIKSVTILGVTATVMLVICLGTIGYQCQIIILAC